MDGVLVIPIGQREGEDAARGNRKVKKISVAYSVSLYFARIVRMPYRSRSAALLSTVLSQGIGAPALVIWVLASISSICGLPSRSVSLGEPVSLLGALHFHRERLQGLYRRGIIIPVVCAAGSAAGSVLVLSFTAPISSRVADIYLLSLL